MSISICRQEMENMEGIIKRLPGASETRPFQVRDISERDLPLVMSAQERSLELLNYDESIFIATEEDCIREYISEDRFLALGVFSKDELCAYLFMDFEASREDSLGKLIDQKKEILPLSKIAILDTITVAPEYRGNKLQRKLAILCSSAAKDKGAEAVYTTVSRTNSFSLKNLIESGFTEAGELQLHGQARVFMKKLL
ncbi:MAG: GNAT family N-acetyltransferase [Clostridiales bacterium]|jgi:ribosomal protein S18 acetylase RimI-like enzyme|nr:GNAT family N-acetyltransferase [Clostridiales bacterium]